MLVGGLRCVQDPVVQLERHVIDHIDTKSCVCIFNGYKRKFRTERARKRHVQCHINAFCARVGFVEVEQCGRLVAA